MTSTTQRLRQGKKVFDDGWGRNVHYGWYQNHRGVYQQKTGRGGKGEREDASNRSSAKAILHSHSTGCISSQGREEKKRRYIQNNLRMGACRTKKLGSGEAQQ